MYMKSGYAEHDGIKEVTMFLAVLRRNDGSKEENLLKNFFLRYDENHPEKGYEAGFFYSNFDGDRVEKIHSYKCPTPDEAIHVFCDISERNTKYAPGEESRKFFDEVTKFSFNTRYSHGISKSSDPNYNFSYSFKPYEIDGSVDFYDIVTGKRTQMPLNIFRKIDAFKGIRDEVEKVYADALKAFSSEARLQADRTKQNAYGQWNGSFNAVLENYNPDSSCPEMTKILISLSVPVSNIRQIDAPTREAPINDNTRNGR